MTGKDGPGSSGTFEGLMASAALFNRQPEIANFARFAWFCILSERDHLFGTSMEGFGPSHNTRERVWDGNIQGQKDR